MQGAGRLTRSKASSVNLYAGTLAFFDASTGYIVADDNAGANAFAGVVYQQCDNSGGSAGDLEVELYTDGIFRLTGSSFTQATNGDLVYAIDNYTIQASSSSASKVGRVVNYVSATVVDVLINVHG
jgi:predicted RecA/RadA family phage recombinase